MKERSVLREQSADTLQVRHPYRRNRKKKHNFNRTVGILAVLSAIFIVGGVIFNGSLASAHDESGNATPGSTCYKSIVIEHGDTLWELAEQYMTDDYESVQEYVQELKRMNHLKDDTIISGEYLIVAYEFAG